MSLLYKRKLIDIVKMHPDLWKLTKKAPNLKQKLWNEVGAELGTTGFDARRQWEILRDQFRREYKRYTNDKNYKSKWIFYNSMLFVRHALRQKDGILYRTNSENEEDTIKDQKMVTIFGYEQGADEKGNLNLETYDLPKIQVRQDLLGATDSSQATTIQGAEGEPSTSAGVSSSCQRPRHNEMYLSPVKRRRRWHVEGPEDEDYHFVMSLLPSLRFIKNTNKLRVRSKIMELIATELDAEMEAGNRRARSLASECWADSEVEEKFRPEEYGLPKAEDN